MELILECPSCHRSLNNVVTSVDLFCSMECRKAGLDVGGCHRCGARYDDRDGWQVAKYNWYLDTTSFCPDCLELLAEIEKRLQRIKQEKTFWESQMYRNPFPIYKDEGEYYLDALGMDTVSFKEFQKLITQYEEAEVDRHLMENTQFYSNLKGLEMEALHLIKLRDMRVGKD